MKLITGLQIEGVRSIQNQSIADLENLNCFVGKNSSGKSNALRALNLFFNGVIEPGKPLDFARDHYEQKPKLKKKKKISITVDFSLPDGFHIRKGLENLKDLGKSFSITRCWELDGLRRPIQRLLIITAEGEIEESDDLAQQFLSLITYRYIPNGTIPSEVLRNESQGIANLIFGRMKGDQHSAALLSNLTEAADRILRDAGDSLQRAGSPLSAPSVATGESLGEMLTMAGFQASGSHGLPVQDEGWGSGHQAFFLYQLLKVLDTSYGRFFGWKQATVWGVEEPEAGLHRDLETQLAAEFRNWCLGENAKIQLFLTTHSSTFCMASDAGYWTGLRGASTGFESMEIPQLTQAAERKGVSEWIHPALSSVWNPIVVTEGPIDSDVLSHVAHLMGRSYIHFTTLPAMHPTLKGGGKDSIIKFLRESSALLKNRPDSAPLLALLDWEVSDQDLAKAQNAYGDHGQQRVLRMNEEHCDATIGADFKGIERFYPRTVVLEASSEGLIAVAEDNNGILSISKDQLEKGKSSLREKVRQIDNIESLASLRSVIEDIERAITSRG